MKVAPIALVLVVAAASPAFAGPRLTDAQFVQASRCQALAKAPALSSAEASTFDALVKDQRRGRADYILEKAAGAGSAASAQARRADEAAKADLTAERDGACKALLAG